MKLKPYYEIDPSKWFISSNPDTKVNQKSSVASDKEHNTSYEYFRQWLLRELMVSYNYPKEYICEDLSGNQTLDLAVTNSKMVFFSLRSKQSNYFIFITGVVDNSSTLDLGKAEKELQKLLANSPSVTIGLVTNGMEMKVIKQYSNPVNFEYISDLPEFNPSFGSGKIFIRNNTQTKINSNSIPILSLPKRLKNLFFEIHSIMRDIDGLHDDIALDELCKLLYAKIYDEIISRPQSKAPYQLLFQIPGCSNESEVSSNVRALYKKACEYDLERNSSKIEGYEHSRGVFKEDIILSDLALCKVVEKLQSFSIVDSDNDIKSIVFQQVLSRAIRSGMGQFFTPDEIVKIAVEVTKPKPSDLILDPFCGSGHFLTRSFEYVTNHYSHLSSQELEKFSLFHLHGIEKSPRMVRIAMTDLLLHGNGYSNIRNTDALANPDNFPDITALHSNPDTSSIDVFDLILTNPPFGKILGDEKTKIFSDFKLAEKIKSVPFEIVAIERCYEFLKKGGKLAIVLPDGNLANAQTQFLRNWLLVNFKLKAIVSLPPETFAPFGTTTKTSLCFFQKFSHESEKDIDYNIVFYKIDNIGYDFTGRAINGNELPDAIKYLTTNIIWD